MSYDTKRQNEVRRRRPLRLMSLLATLLLIAAACGTDTDGDAEAGDDLEVGEEAEAGEEGTETTTSGDTGEQVMTVAPPNSIEAIDPHASASPGMLMATQQIFEYLVAFEEGEIIPRVATDWETPDELTWIFTLRDDVTFHDGTPLTAEEVAFSIERLATAQSSLAPVWGAFESVEASGDYEVTITTSDPMATVLNALSLTAIVTTDVEPVPEETGDAPSFDNPVGAGPFKVDEWIPSESLVLSAFDDHFLGRPELDRIEIVDIPEMSSRVTALITGEIDMTWSVAQDSMGPLIDDENIVVDEIPSHTNYWAWFNSDSEPLDDARVRRALWHAVDIDGLREGLFGDSAQLAQAPVSEPVFGWTPQDPYEYDPDLARELLAEAGVDEGLELDLQYAQGDSPQIESVVQILASAWEDIGVTINLLGKERSVWVQDLVALEWDINVQDNTNLTGDADATTYRLYHSSANRTGYSNPDLDAALEATQAEFDQERRLQLYDEANSILWDEAVGMWMMDLNENYAYNDRVEGFTPAPAFPRFHEVRLSN